MGSGRTSESDRSLLEIAVDFGLSDTSTGKTSGDRSTEAIDTRHGAVTAVGSPDNECLLTIISATNANPHRIRHK